MSRAFVKEPDEGAPDEGLPERQISDHPNYVTPAGLRQLEEKRRRAREAAARAAATGTTPPDELDYVDRDLRYFTARLESGDPGGPGRQPRRMVAFGAAVTVSQPGGERRTFTIVGEDEADLKAGKISYVSPLAEALLDARVGKPCCWRRPAGNIELTIEAIDYPEELTERRVQLGAPVESGCAAYSRTTARYAGVGSCPSSSPVTPFCVSQPSERVGFSSLITASAHCFLPFSSQAAWTMSLLSMPSQPPLK